MTHLTSIYLTDRGSYRARRTSAGGAAASSLTSAGGVEEGKEEEERVERCKAILDCRAYDEMLTLYSAEQQADIGESPDMPENHPSHLP